MEQFIRRDGKGKSINVHASIHAFAMAIGRQVQEEKDIRRNKDFRKAIRAIFKENPDCQFITKPTLVQMVVRHLNATTANYQKLMNQVDRHITLNTGGYLLTRRGQGGGVGLNRKGKTNAH